MLLDLRTSFVKKIVPLLLALAGLLLCADPALATPTGVVQGGYDEATGSLEGGFKIMAIKRVFSEDECYPGPNEIVTTLRRNLHRDVVVAANLNSVQGVNLINVIDNQTDCDRLVLALRAGAKQRIFVLDSNYGPVYLAGGKKDNGQPEAGSAGPLRDLTSASKEFRMSDPDGTSRLEVLCPDDSHPMGGGFYNATPLGGDGEGVYSHSYERLGAQGGFHDTATLVSPSQKPTRAARGAAGALRAGAGPDSLPACDHLRPSARDRIGDRALPEGHSDLLRRLSADELHDTRGQTVRWPYLRRRLHHRVEGGRHGRLAGQRRCNG